MRRRATAVAFAVMVSGIGACAEDLGTLSGATLTVYVSVPLSGPAREEGQAIADAAQKALDAAGGKAGSVELRTETLDVAGRNESRFDPVTAAANARTAAEDSTAIAYIGELDSGATRTSLPITNAAGILQVAAGSGASDLVTEETFSDDVPLDAQPTGTRTYVQLAPTYDPGEKPAAIDPTALGAQAMELILEAIEGAEDPTDREFVVDAAFSDPTVSPTGELR